ncbi:6-phosphogluconolactonase [Kiloniella antarctica]|uniref:6-phosphogluconolactonase n=1 Tax=Kiloniella antarctica TaxID=1550907 RepID=A0ABW5BL14_9PROT
MKIVTAKTENELYLEVVDRAVDLLKQEIENCGRASLILSGGNTPQKYLPELFSRPLDWEKIIITLSDERWVPLDHDDSNEGMIRKCIERVPEAHKAKFISFYNEDETALASVNRLESNLIAEVMPFSVALLGMGTDGHICSLFPNAINVEGPNGICSLNIDAPLHPRISLFYKALTKIKFPILILTGTEKRKVFDLATSGVMAYPVSELLKHENLLIIQIV